MLSSFLHKLRRQGVRLWLLGEALKFKAYRDAPLSPEDRDYLREHKADVIAWLKEHPDFFNFLPLSQNQQSLWLIDRMDSGNAAYNLAHAVRLADGIDHKILRQAFELLCQRHAILRTAYAEGDGEAVQKVREDFSPPFTLEEQYLFSRDDIVAWAKKQADKPFDLGAGEVCRANLLINHCGDDSETIFQLTVHHIAADFWSCEVLFDELLGIYKDLQAKRLSHYGEVTRDYFDWSQEQFQWLTSEASATARSFWQRLLGDGCESLELITDYPRPAVQTYDGEELSFQLDPDQSRALREQAKALGVTPFVFCLSVFQTLMHRYSGQTEFLIGTPTSGRMQREHQRTVGYLVNPVVLRCDCRENPSFRQLMARVNEHSKAVLEHEAFPFRSLLEQLNVPRDPSRTPLFQHMFTLTHVHPQQHQNLISDTYLSEQRGAAHDLNLVLLDDRRGFTGKWRYNRALFSRRSVEGALNNYLEILDTVCRLPDIRLSEIDLQGGGVSRLSGEQDSSLRNHAGQGALALFHQQVRLRASAPALRFGEEVLSYGELDRYAGQLAVSLAQQGVKPQQCVGLLMERSPALIASVIALWKLGAAYAALDSDWPHVRIRQLCDEGSLDALIVGSDTATIPSGMTIHWVQEHLAQAALSQAQPLPTVTQHPDQAAYCIYTSGSTGQPKAVRVTQRNLAHYILAVSRRLQMPEAEQSLSLMSLGTLATDLGHTAVYGALLQGHCLHLPTREQVNDPVALSQALRRHPVSYLKLTPSYVRALSNVLAEILPSHGLVLGGEPLSGDLVNTIRKQGANCRIINHYGPTETTVGVLSYEIEESGTDSEGSCPIGQPFANTWASVLDAHLNPVPIGVAGELYLGGEGLAEGYSGKPGLTAERFVPSPFSDGGERLYRTGDRVRLLHNGNLQYLGRVDHQVKVRGNRVELGEIEHRLRRQDTISEAVVVLHQNQQVGTDQLLAYVQTEGEWHPDRVAKLLRQELPDYMVPSLWQPVEGFTRLSSGKIDRRRLPKLSVSEGEGESGNVAPRSLVEQQLYDIWCQVLNRDDFGVTDSFFDLGGDSILSLQIITQAKKAGIGLTPKIFFDARTIEGLAQKANLKSEQHETRKQESLTAPVPLTPIQHWFFEHQQRSNTPANPAHWNQSLIFTARQALDVAKLRQALTQLIQHHDGLRLVFTPQGEQRYTTIDDRAVQACFIALDAPPHLGDKNAILNSAWFDGQVRQLQSDFALDKAPLFKLLLITPDNAGEAVVVMTAHHLIVDGVSWRIILEDLETLYHIGQSASAVLAKTDSYSKWSRLLQQQNNQGVAHADMDYWREQCRNPVDKTTCPPAYDHARNTVGDSANFSLKLNGIYTGYLLGPALNVYRLQVNECLVAALVPVLGQFFGSTSPTLPIELESHGRDNRLSGGDAVDVSRTVGWFTSRYPVCIPSRGNDWATTIAEVKNRLRAVPHNGLTFGMLRYLAGESSLPEGQGGLITVNYLGQVDAQLARSSLFALSEHFAPHMRSADSPRTHIIDLNMQVFNGQLQMVWTFPRHCLSVGEISRLAGDYRRQLTALLDHCLDPNAGKLDASDFDEAGISDDELELLLNELG